MSKTELSPRWTLTKQDLLSVGRGLLITSAGAALMYLVDALAKLDLGSAWWSPIGVVVLAALVNSLKKFSTDSQYLK